MGAKEEGPRVVDASFVAGAMDAKHLPAPALAEIAFAGRSNVGKSSLLNTLVQRKNLVRTSRTPGCTRQINVFEAKLIDDFLVHLVDLPGYGFAQRSKTEKKTWGPMIEGYLRTRINLRALVVLVDVRRGIEEEELGLLDFMSRPRPVEAPKPVETLVLVTKIDKVGASVKKSMVERIRKQTKLHVIGFSSETGEGRPLLWEAIRNAVL